MLNWERRKLHKYARNFSVIVLILLMTTMLLALIPNIASVKAQGQATVVMFVPMGGTTSPTGNTTYPDGTNVTLEAYPGEGFAFVAWNIASSAGAYSEDTNPYILTVSAGVTYGIQAIFTPEQPLPYTLPNATDYSTAAIVVVLAGVGGTTTPGPGWYALANAAQTNLTAYPNSGFTFSNWIIGGYPLSHGGYSFTDTPTNNPYTIGHGYGYTYYYQPVFVPVGTTMPSPSAATSASPTPSPMGGLSTDEWIIIALIVVIVIILIAFGAFASMKRKKA